MLEVSTLDSTFVADICMEIVWYDAAAEAVDEKHEAWSSLWKPELVSL